MESVWRFYIPVLYVNFLCFSFNTFDTQVQNADVSYILKRRFMDNRVRIFDNNCSI